VTSLTGICPLLSFTLDGRNVRTLPTTLFLGDTCSKVKDHKKVTVLGTLQADGLVLATQIELEKGKDNEDEQNNQRGGK
jgi:Domain of unknown function (DUF5666)